MEESPTTSLRPLRISAFSALNGSLNTEDAEIRRERREAFQIKTPLHGTSPWHLEAIIL